MGKQKYCYVIVNKENGSLLINSVVLPIYWRKNVASVICKEFNNYIVHKIELDKIERLILSSKPI